MVVAVALAMIYLWPPAAYGETLNELRAAHGLAPPRERRARWQVLEWDAPDSLR